MPPMTRSQAPAAAPHARHWLMALLAAWPAVTLAQSSPAVSSLVAFSGSQPASAPVLGPGGALYGITSVASIVAGGLIYRLEPTGSAVETLYQLKVSDGYGAVGGLLLGSGPDPVLFGTTTFGSTQQANSGGTVFSVKTDGNDFTVLHTFASYATANDLEQPINTDGALPQSELVEGNDGFLYGVTSAGGPNGTGVVFKVSRDGTGFAVLHAFGPVDLSDHDNNPATAAIVVPPTDGMSPTGTLLAGADDYLYGTAAAGGANNTGTIFRVRSDGSDFAVLHTFPALVTPTTGVATNTGGGTPAAGLTDGQDSRYYGVASVGGSAGYGTVFAFDPVGRVFTVLYDFDFNKGARPTGELLLGADGKLYGTTASGGTNASGTATQFGTVFSIARDGTGFTSLYSFQNTDGSGPTGKMVQLDESTFVGLTTAGGNCGQGTVFRLSLTGATVTGVTNCGRSNNNNSGGGGIAPALLLLLAVAGVARRARADR